MAATLAVDSRHLRTLPSLLSRRHVNEAPPSGTPPGPPHGPSRFRHSWFDEIPHVPISPWDHAFMGLAQVTELDTS